MDCGCNCFGIASSSRFPVKRYNLLVPDIFPKKNPDVSPKVEASTERKYKKLTEYVEKNPHRGPKVRYIPLPSDRSTFSAPFSGNQVTVRDWQALQKLSALASC